MNKYVIGGIAAAIFIIMVALIVVFSIFGLWPVVRDVVIVLTALISVLAIVFLAAAVFYLSMTMLNIKRELTPVLESLKTTSETVSKTARVAGDLGVAPTVRTASVLMGAVETASIVLRQGHVRTRAQKRAQRRTEVERELMARGELNGNL